MSPQNNHLVRFLLITVAAFLSISAFLVVLEPAEAGKAVFTGTEEHEITIEAALTYVANYQSTQGEQLTAGYMGRNIFEKILAQENAVGIRIYNGRRDDGSPTFVVIGVDRDGNDLIHGVIGQKPVGCPPYCATGALSLGTQTQSIALK